MDKAPSFKLKPGDRRQFILDNTELLPCPLVPEVQLRVASKLYPLWHLTEEQLEERGLPPPFWAFAWAGGQALARYVLDTPEEIASKRVLDFATGSGLVGIAAKMAGAVCVGVNDIDPFAMEAAEINARANHQMLQLLANNLIGDPLDDWDVLITGDILYEQPLADDVLHWLRALAESGKTVLIGDPGRTYLPKSGLEKLVTYAIKTTRELEDTDVRCTSVWRVIHP